jgi:hypothetical protein
MLNKLPQNIKIRNKRYFINTDFRLMINFEKKMQEIELTELKNEEIFYILKSFCPAFFKIKHKDMKSDIKLLINKLLWFYSCGNRKNYHKSKKSKTKIINNIFSYEYDDEFIWSAFYQYYRIDLSEDKLHWWKYMALFKSLPEECKFEKIKSYRSYKGNDERMKKLKDYWNLPLNEKLQQELEETTKMLLKYSKEV